MLIEDIAAPLVVLVVIATLSMIAAKSIVLPFYKAKQTYKEKQQKIEEENNPGGRNSELKQTLNKVAGFVQSAPLALQNQQALYNSMKAKGASEEQLKPIKAQIDQLSTVVKHQQLIGFGVDLFGQPAIQALYNVSRRIGKWGAI